MKKQKTFINSKLTVSNITSISLWIISSQWGYLYSQLYKHYSSSPSVNSPWNICYLRERRPINSQCYSVQMSSQAGSWFMALLDIKGPCIQGRPSPTQWIQAGPEILIFHNLSEFYFFPECACSWTIIRAFFFFLRIQLRNLERWLPNNVGRMWMFCKDTSFHEFNFFSHKPNNLNTCVICL